MDDSVEICLNCHKLLDESDKVIHDGSGATAHMYSQECVRYLREEIRLLNERIDELESKADVQILPKQ